MISKECYVYISLPSQYEPVTAGKFVLETDDYGINVGRFIYGKSYLARSDAVELDPVELKLSDKAYQTTILKGVFGAIRDASPDFWGRELINWHLGGQADEMEYLLFSPDDRAGALWFGLNQTPPPPKKTFNQMMDLKDLQNYADEMLQNSPSGDVNKEQVKKLLLLGTSMGGARPKTVVEHNNNLWIAKFNAPDDYWDNALVEHAMLKLAQKCDLAVTESKIVSVGKKNVLLIKRFDREKAEKGYFRFRMISAMTVLRSGDNHIERRNWSYMILAEELRKFSATAKQDAEELFKRMVFNALISNLDDHPRNHAFIAQNTDWKLSPAYDLTPSIPINIEHRDLALKCGKHGRFANRYNLLSGASRFLLTNEEAEKIIEDMYFTVKNSWYSVARSVGVTEIDCEKIKPAFAYEGFSYGL